MSQPSTGTKPDLDRPAPEPESPAAPPAICQVCGVRCRPGDSTLCRVCGEPVLNWGWAP